MAEIYEYRRGEQLERHIGQFMRVFSGFQVRDGVVRNGEFLTKKVPVVYGNMSRIVASILTKRDFLANAQLPIMAVSMAGLTPDLDNKRTPHHREERAVERGNGEVEVLERLTGPPFTMNMELSVYASSTTELFDIIEQIVLIFNPRVAIQSTSDMYDADYITEISLTGLQPEIMYPMGTDKPVVMMTLQFDLPMRFKYPKGFSNKIIEQIIANVKDDDGELETIVITRDIDIGEIVVERGSDHE